MKIRTTIAALILSALSAMAGNYERYEQRYGQSWQDKIRDIERQQQRAEWDAYWANRDREKQLDEIERQQERIIEALEEE